MSVTMKALVRALRELNALNAEARSSYFQQLSPEVREGLARHHLTPEYLQLQREEKEREWKRKSVL